MVFYRLYCRYANGASDSVNANVINVKSVRDLYCLTLFQKKGEFDRQFNSEKEILTLIIGVLFFMPSVKGCDKGRGGLIMTSSHISIHVSKLLE